MRLCHHDVRYNLESVGVWLLALWLAVLWQPEIRSLRWLLQHAAVVPVPIRHYEFD